MFWEYCVHHRMNREAGSGLSRVSPRGGVRLFCLLNRQRLLNSSEDKMNKRILLMGVRPTMTPEMYTERAARFEDLQGDYRSFVLIADCQAALTQVQGDVDLEASVASTVQFLVDAGFDSGRSICFLQSQIPQLAELSRLAEDGPTPVGSVVADMLMFRPARILGGAHDEPSFDLALELQTRFGSAFHDQNAEFEAIPESAEPDGDAKRDGGSDQREAIRDVLNYGGATARIEAQKTLEIVREAVGLNYALFK